MDEGEPTKDEGEPTGVEKEPTGLASRDIVRRDPCKLVSIVRIQIAQLVPSKRRDVSFGDLDRSSSQGRIPS